LAIGASNKGTGWKWKRKPGRCEEFLNRVRINRKYWLVAGLGCLLAVSGLLVIKRRYGMTRYPTPTSGSYTAVFAWDGALRNFAVVNDTTGKEEENIDVLRIIRGEAQGNIRIIVARMGLQRATGNLPCHVVGIKEFYRISCEHPLELDADEYDPDAKAPLMVAARAGDVGKIEQSIRAGASVNARDQHGVTVLMRSSYLNDATILKYLIKAGADLNVQDYP
jgi:hypothetical protein